MVTVDIVYAGPDAPAELVFLNVTGIHATLYGAPRAPVVLLALVSPQLVTRDPALVSDVAGPLTRRVNVVIEGQYFSGAWAPVAAAAGTLTWPRPPVSVTVGGAACVNVTLVSDQRILADCVNGWPASGVLATPAVVVTVNGTASAPTNATLLPPRPLAPALVAATPQIAIGSRHACWTTEVGALACAGVQVNSALGCPGATLAGADTATTGAAGCVSRLQGWGPVASIAAGATYTSGTGAPITCAVNITGRLSCAGLNTGGGLWNGNPSSTHTDLSAVAAAVTPNMTAPLVAVHASSDYACILSSAGLVQCLGASNRPLGYDSGYAPSGLTPADLPPASKSLPPAAAVAALFRAVVQLALGPLFSCLLYASGEVACHGVNTACELAGSARTTLVSTSGAAAPVPLPGGLRATYVTVGLHHACALTDAGTAYCWGQSTYEAGGKAKYSGLTVCDPTAGGPVPVGPAGAAVVGIAAGQYVTCAITAPDAGGSLYCWGASFSDYSLLGLNSTGGAGSPSASRVPLPCESQVGGCYALQVASNAVAASTYVIAALGDGAAGRAVYAWGFGADGLLGIPVVTVLASTGGWLTAAFPLGPVPLTPDRQRPGLWLPAWPLVQAVTFLDYVIDGADIYARTGTMKVALTGWVPPGRQPANTTLWGWIEDQPCLTFRQLDTSSYECTYADTAMMAVRRLPPAYTLSWTGGPGAPLYAAYECVAPIVQGAEVLGIVVDDNGNFNVNISINGGCLAGTSDLARQSPLAPPVASGRPLVPIALVVHVQRVDTSDMTYPCDIISATPTRAVVQVTTGNPADFSVGRPLGVVYIVSGLPYSSANAGPPRNLTHAATAALAPQVAVGNVSTGMVTVRGNLAAVPAAIEGGWPLRYITVVLNPGGACATPIVATRGLLVANCSAVWTVANVTNVTVTARSPSGLVITGTLSLVPLPALPLTPTQLATVLAGSASAAAESSCWVLPDSGGVACAGMASHGQRGCIRATVANVSQAATTPPRMCIAELLAAPGGGVPTGVPAGVASVSLGVNDRAPKFASCALSLQGDAITCVGSTALNSTSAFASAPSWDGVGASSPGAGTHALPGGRMAVSLVAGGGTLYALLDSGEAVAWAGNEACQATQDAIKYVATPLAAQTPVVPGFNAPSMPPASRGPAAQLAAGSDFACSLNVHGAVSCWGGNAAAQLTTALPLSSLCAATVATAYRVPLAEPAVFIAAGSAHACALLAVSANVACWGTAALASTGDVEVRGTPTPLVVDGALITAVALACGDGSTCVISTTSRLLCAGLGVVAGNGPAFEVPLTCIYAGCVPIALAAAVSPSPDAIGTEPQTLFVTVAYPDGGRSVFAVGANDFGQLGLSLDTVLPQAGLVAGPVPLAPEGSPGGAGVYPFGSVDAGTGAFIPPLAWPIVQSVVRSTTVAALSAGASTVSFTLQVALPPARGAHSGALATTLVGYMNRVPCNSTVRSGALLWECRHDVASALSVIDADAAPLTFTVAAASTSGPGLRLWGSELCALPSAVVTGFSGDDLDSAAGGTVTIAFLCYSALVEFSSLGIGAITIELSLGGVRLQGCLLRQSNITCAYPAPGLGAVALNLTTAMTVAGVALPPRNVSVTVRYAAGTVLVALLDTSWTASAGTMVVRGAGFGAPTAASPNATYSGYVEWRADDTTMTGVTLPLTWWSHNLLWGVLPPDILAGMARGPSQVTVRVGLVAASGGRAQPIVVLPPFALSPVLVGASGGGGGGAVGAGESHVCFALANGGVACAGELVDFQGSCSGVLSRNAPVGDPTSCLSRLPGSPMVRADVLAAAAQSTCVLGPVVGALSTSGGIFCTGTAPDGETGIGAGGVTSQWAGDAANASMPALAGVTTLVGGTSHYCAVSTAFATLRCVGEPGAAGWETGRSATWRDAPPLPLLGQVNASGWAVEPIATVAAGPRTTCAVTQGGDVACFGANVSCVCGYVAPGPSASQDTVAAAAAGRVPLPAKVPAVGVAVGSTHAAAVLADGSLWCWGDVAGGCSVDGSVHSPSCAPVLVLPSDAGIGNVVAVAAGLNLTCCIITGGAAAAGSSSGSGVAQRAYCTGAYATAVLAGNGTVEPATGVLAGVLVPVILPCAAAGCEPVQLAIATGGNTVFVVAAYAAAAAGSAAKLMAAGLTGGAGSAPALLPYTEVYAFGPNAAHMLDSVIPTPAGPVLRVPGGPIPVAAPPAGDAYTASQQGSQLFYPLLPAWPVVQAVTAQPGATLALSARQLVDVILHGWAPGIPNATLRGFAGSAECSLLQVNATAWQCSLPLAAYQALASWPPMYTLSWNDRPGPAAAGSYGCPLALLTSVAVIASSAGTLLDPLGGSTIRINGTCFRHGDSAVGALATVGTGTPPPGIAVLVAGAPCRITHYSASSLTCITSETGAASAEVVLNTTVTLLPGLSWPTSAMLGVAPPAAAQRRMRHVAASAACHRADRLADIHTYQPIDDHRHPARPELWAA
jgi:alpha-tubulin suppressor-like RCC1 family protein